MNEPKTHAQADRYALGRPHDAGSGAPDRDAQRNWLFQLAETCAQVAWQREEGVISDAEAFLALKQALRRYHDPESRNGGSESVGKEDGSGPR